ncbi:sugar phosphate isomerase/epimerase family protein [Halalkalibaculum sp. DA3122]|uniref:sugar phosphate isomerase/epimerase family protein n=1 Tax=Halalkalibaculum sp. DA3122 TaxID=3373607 RepID=UPI003754EEB7
MNQDRRTFLKTVGKAMLGSAALTSLPAGSLFSKSASDTFFDISLAQWSLHRALFGGDLDNLDFAGTAKNEFGISAVEYVNQFFIDKANDQSYLKEMKQRADDNGVRSVLIMCDGEGALGDPDEGERQQAVENHHKWVTAAKYLGCHSIRVNAQSRGSWDEQMNLAADGLRSLTEFADQHDINVIVENHGGLSSNAEWLVGVIKQVDHPRCGTLPDFGNFNISENESYDRYKGTRMLMPYAKGVSAKSYSFDSNGYEKNIDFEKLISIVKDAGYTGYVGIEYEGSELSEYEGIKATKKLLEMVG